MGTIGNALQELRAERRLSATEAAAGAGTTVSTYLKIERPDLSVIRVLEKRNKS